MWVQQSVVNVQVQHLEVYGYGYSPNVNVRVQHMEVYESRYSPSVVNVHCSGIAHGSVLSPSGSLPVFSFQLW